MGEVVTQVEEQAGAVVVHVSGEITMVQAPQFHKILVGICDRTPEHLVINLEGVPYIDSSGVGTLAEIYRRTSRYDGRLSLVSLNKMVRSVFEITRLDKVFSIYDSVELALRP